uniref:Uncharacterized protein n=1 Tax=Tanacetum cinerariifolium TaxID=118510 RepID=A0A6L2MWQ7_TANCI|nr:hypothetical protein [Tanacetum cinerariifolium]
MLLCKQEEAGIQLNAEQADWRDDTDDDELEDQELEAHYMYMAQLQEVSPDAGDSGSIFDDEPLQKMELECAKVRGDLLSYKMDYHKSSTKYNDTINALNQTISEMKDKLSAHQETISILSKQKEAQIKLYKTRKDNVLDKVIELENKVKRLLPHAKGLGFKHRREGFPSGAKKMRLSTKAKVRVLHTAQLDVTAE